MYAIRSYYGFEFVNTGGNAGKPLYVAFCALNPGLNDNTGIIIANLDAVIRVLREVRYIQAALGSYNFV